MMDTVKYSKEVAKGSFWTLSGNVLFYMVSFLYMIVIARFVPPEELGLYYLALSIVSLLSALDDLGFNGALSRYVPFFEAKNQHGKIRHLLNIGYATVISVALVLSVILFLSADTIAQIYQNPQLAPALQMLVVILVLANIKDLNISFLRGRKDVKSMQVVKNLFNASKLVLTTTAFFFLGVSVFSLSLGLILSYFVSIAASFYFSRKSSAKLPDGDDIIENDELIYELVPFGLMIGLIAYLNTLLISTNSVILGYLTNPADSTTVVAVFSIATKLAMQLVVLPNSIGTIFLPIMAYLYGKGSLEQMRGVAETTQRWSLFLTVPFGLVMIAFSGDILGALYGNEYRAGAFVMSLIVVGVIIKSSFLVLSNTLSAMRRVDIQLKIVAVTGVVNFILNFILIPEFGMDGSAMAAFISILAALLMIVYYSKKLVGFSLPPEVFKIGAVAVFTFIFIMLIKPAAPILLSQFPQIGEGGVAEAAGKALYMVFLGMLAVISSTVFFAFVLLLKCFRKEDVEMMKSALKKARVPEGLVMLFEKIVMRGVSA
jgi:O-antigen/teichoic acid export membrane protein